MKYLIKTNITSKSLGKKLYKGDEVEADPSIGDEWVKNNLAVKIKKKIEDEL